MIITKLKGGMGNQMFQYAIGRALSVKNNVPLGLDLAYLLDRTPRKNFTFRNYDLDAFNIKAEIVEQSKISFINKTFKGRLGLFFDLFRKIFIKLPGIEKGHNFDSKVFEIGESAYLDGYWQSPKYFEEIKDIILKDFTLKNILQMNIKNLMEVIKKENSLCVHVRRGDYVGNSNHEIVGKEYYNIGIEKIKSLTNIDKVYIFSDDIKWCEENMKFGFPTIFVGENYAGEKGEGHLFLMKSCKNFLIPNSSFSWWAAWLSDSKDKIVVVPKQWFCNKNISSDDLIPKEWIKI